MTTSTKAKPRQRKVPAAAAKKARRVELGAQGSNSSSADPAGNGVPRQEASVTYDVAMVPVDRLHRHPANRETSPEDVAELAESIRRDGFQQPIKARTVGAHWGLPARHLQIVFGERRWTAARVAGLDLVPVIVEEDMDDPRALAMIATENGHRKDLNDIDRGRLLQSLIAAVDDGGAGLTVKAAAAAMGVAESTARNLLRVVKLPEYWTRQVISGEMPGSFLRPVASYADYPAVLQLIEHNHRDDAETGWAYVENWGSRDAVQQSVESIVWGETRPLTADDRTADESAPGRCELRFDASSLTQKQLGELEVIEVPDGKGGILQRCVNSRQWYDLQQSRDVARTVGGKPTRKQQQANAKEAAEKLQRAVDRWRLEWLRWLCARALATCAESQRWQLLVWVAWCRSYQGPSSTDLETALVSALKDRGIRAKLTYDTDVFDLLGKVPSGEQAVLAAEFLCRLLYPGWITNEAGTSAESVDCKVDNLPVTLIEGLAENLGIDLATAWSDAQAASQRPAIWIRFFEAHNKEQLDALGTELGVSMLGFASESNKVKALTTKAKILKLPAAIKPLRKTRRK